MEKLNIAIDGPAGAGKTSVSKLLAKKLNIEYFNTGALYRSYALKCLEKNLDATNESVAKQIAKSATINVEFIDGNQHTFVDNIDVTNDLSNDKVSQVASQISAHKCIREKLIQIQRDVASKYDVVMEGRDIGSVVLPYARFKFYLDATPEIRAKRRYEQLQKDNQNVDYQKILDEIKERDYRDSHREISPLVKCKDSIFVDSSDKTIEETVNFMFANIVSKEN